MNIISDFKSIHGDRYDYSLVNYKHLNTKIQIICKRHNIIFEQSPKSHLIGKTHVCAECIREEVIESFKQIHVNKYDYSLMEYTGALNKIKIICPEHGVFEQTPNNHKNGQGCPNRSILSQEQVIEQFQEVHGDKYDYSLMEFKNITLKIKIKCNKHNIIFEQTPNIHLANKTHVCAECIREQIIEQFKKVHEDEYDYSLMEYTGALHKIKIICPKHGVFEQKPNNHKNGQGCPNCSILPQEQVIEQFQEVHGDKYDYSSVKYKNTKSKVNIICPKHGVFEQTPNNHKKGQGCPNCTVLSQEEIIKQFKETHGDKYNYHLMEYTSTLNKIKIICPKHGVFEQTPNNHKNGQGCSHCANELTAKEIYQNKSAILYYISINDSQHKVGISKTSINQRYQKEIKEGIDIKVIREIEFQDGYQALLLEQEILNKSQDRGTLLKEDCIIDGGYSEVRKLNFIDIFDKVIKEYKDYKNEK